MDIYDSHGKEVERAGNLYGKTRSLFHLLPVSSIVSLCILCAIWFWCRGGGVTSIRIVAHGNHFQAFIDDRLIADRVQSFSSDKGGVAFYEGDLLCNQLYWGIPLIQSLVAVKVTDDDSGKLLLNQNFSQPLDPIWSEKTGTCSPGPLGYRCGRNSAIRLGTGYREWENYTVELTVRNFLSMEAWVRYRDEGNMVAFIMRPFRELDSHVIFATEGKRHFEWSDKPYYKTREIVMNIVLLFLYFFPQCIIALAVILIIFGLNWVFASLVKRNYYWYEVLFLIILFLASFGYLLWINYYLLDHIPHVQDSIAYNFQARLLSRGRIFAPSPPVPAAFALEHFLVCRGLKWFGQYPFGHPFLLMFGHLINRPWVIPPLIGALVLLIIYLISKELFSRKVAVVSSLLALSSPFFQMNASNFMSHSSGSFYLALAVLFLIRSCSGQIHSHRKLYAFLSGLSLGFLFNTRPLNAIAAIGISGAAMVYCLFAKRIGFKGILCFCLGGLLMLAVFLSINYCLMGNPLSSPAGNPVSFFNKDYPIGQALMNYYTLMTIYLMVIFGWPSRYVAIFLLSFIVLGKKNLWNIYLFLLFCGMTLMNLFYTALNTTAHMYGPRYVYETFFIFIIMVVHGWDQAIQFIERGLNYVYGCSRRSRIITLVTHAVFLSLLIVWTYDAERRWVGKRDNLYNFSFIPWNLFDLKGFNHVSGDMVERIGRSNIHNALIFVDPESEWWCYGSVASLNSPFLDSDIIIARDMGHDTNKKIIEAFPGRTLYRVNVKRKELRGY